LELPSVSFLPLEDSTSLEKLRRGPHDDLEALDLARRGAEMLAEDRYDRLLSLASLSGVDQLGYQIETVLRVLKRFRGRVLLADEVGLGKTIEACMILKEYLLRGHVRRVLILVPPALVGQWKGELEEKFAVPALTTLDAAFRRDPKAFWSSGPVLVASLALARNAAHCENLQAQQFDLVVVDEAHHLKNRATRGWELVNGLRSKFFLMLTATPVETNLKELYNLVTLLRPGTLGTEAEFRRRFVRASDPTQPRDPEKLRDLLRDVMIRNTRARCGVLLPPRTARTLIVRPTPAEEALYRLVLETTRRHIAERGQEHRMLFRQLLEEAGSSPLAVAETASRARSGEVGAELAADLARIEEASRAVPSTAKIERLSQHLPGGKALVFSRFRSTLEEIAGDLERRRIPFVNFHGGMAAAEKDRAVAEFAGPSTEMMLCSEIGGEGRNLQFCHRLINFDLPWNPMKIEQRIGRLSRIGQEHDVHVFNLVARGTVEESILHLLDAKLSMFELVIGEIDMVLGNLEGEKDLPEVIADLWAASSGDDEFAARMEVLGNRLLAAKLDYLRQKAADEKLFGNRFAPEG
jgi:SNF2 family DNA or RNA helicase